MKYKVLFFIVGLFVSVNLSSLTNNQISDYQSELRYKEAAVIEYQNFKQLANQYLQADSSVRNRLQYKVLDSFYKVGWSQLYGRLYNDNIKTYQLFMKLKIPASKWGNNMLWTVRSCMAIAVNEAVRGYYKLALDWIKLAETMYLAHPYIKKDGRTIDPFKEFYNNGYNFYALRQFIKKKMTILNKKPKYTMTVLYIVYPNVDYTAVYFGDKRGRFKRHYTWNKLDYDNLIVAQKMMKIAIEAMSEGNLSLKFITKKVNTRVYENPKKRSGIYYTNSVIQERDGLIKQYPHDLVVDHVLSHDSGAGGMGGGGQIVTYHLPNSSVTWSTLVHEFFHCTESRYGWRPHIWRQKNAVPGWSGVPWDEMSYYNWRFKTGILNVVNHDTSRNGYSGWISQFNWGPKSLIK